MILFSLNVVVGAIKIRNLFEYIQNNKNNKDIEIRLIINVI